MQKKICEDCVYCWDTLDSDDNVSWSYCDLLKTRIDDGVEYCEFKKTEDDMFIDIDETVWRKKISKKKLNAVHKDKLKKLAKTNYYPAGCRDNNHRYCENDEAVCGKRWYRSKRSQEIKREAARKMRHYNGDLANGSAYKRVYDFWWELY